MKLKKMQHKLKKTNSKKKFDKEKNNYSQEKDESDIDMDEEMTVTSKPVIPKNKKTLKKKKAENIMEEEEDEIENEDSFVSSKKHKESLMKLKQTDPEFFKFMQKEDADLLNFEESDEEEEMDDEEMEDEDEHVKSKIPKAKKDSNGRLIFDGNMYDYLEEFLDPESEKFLNKKPDIEDINFAVDAFQACVARVGADIDVPKYIINEQSIFESVVRLSLRSLGEIFKRFSLAQGSGSNKKRKLFKRFQGQLKTYLSGVLLFLNEVQSDGVIISTLKAIQQMLVLFGKMTKIARNLIKVLVRIWTRKTLQCRLMAYVCMNQMLKSYPEHLSYLYKSAYLGFVSNSRAVTAESWPLLQFMHRTFAELTLILPDSAYPYAFVYIRQTAIHLRNAIISKNRQDLVHTVYNWQLMQCLYLWVRVVSKAHAVNGTESICELAYPLTQIIIGVSQLQRAPRFLPLRFHCISLLIQLQASCTVYIPVLALTSELLEDIFSMLNSKPKPSSVSTKSIDLDCVLKVHSQSREIPAFRTAVCEQLFKLMLQAAHSMCSQPAFPDLCSPVLHRISNFLKKGRIGDNGRLFRGLAEKLTEHSKFVSDIMLQRDVVLNDEMNMRAAKFALNNPDAPLRVYYRQWEKVWKMRQEVINKSDDHHKRPLKEKKLQQAKEETVVEPTPKASIKKKRVSTPAAKKADSTLPDTFADLGDWSD